MRLPWYDTAPKRGVKLRDGLGNTREIVDYSALTLIDYYMAGKEYPYGLPDEGVGIFFSEVCRIGQDSKGEWQVPIGDPIEESDLLPGDQIWFWNRYYRKGDTEWEKKHFSGEQGSNVSYFHDGLVISLYKRRVSSIEEYQGHMNDGWNTVIDARDKGKATSPTDFEIRCVRRPRDCDELIKTLRRLLSGQQPLGRRLRR